MKPKKIFITNRLFELTPDTKCDSWIIIEFIALEGKSIQTWAVTKMTRIAQGLNHNESLLSGADFENLVCFLRKDPSEYLSMTQECWDGLKAVFQQPIIPTVELL